jgi:hypothetical protein
MKRIPNKYKEKKEKYAKSAYEHAIMSRVTNTTLREYRQCHGKP